MAQFLTGQKDKLSMTQTPSEVTAEVNAPMDKGQPMVTFADLAGLTTLDLRAEFERLMSGKTEVLAGATNPTEGMNLSETQAYY